MKTLLIGVGILLVIAMIATRDDRSQPPTSAVATSTTQPGAEAEFQFTNNRAHMYLVAHPLTRAQVLAKAVGEGCRGESAFYQASMACKAAGMPAGTALWDVRCTNGKSYIVSVFPNGRSNVMDCALLEAVHGGHCFTKMDDDSCSQSR